MTGRARALGALQGLAIGDALGMPTQLLWQREIPLRFGEIDGFRDAPADHPIAGGMRAGSITDDTEQALLIARALIDGDGVLDPENLAHRLADWEKVMRARGSLDLLGPSTRAAVAAVLAGTPAEEAGRNGTTNGAAMRVTPVGIAFPPELPRLVEAVHDSARVSHDTGIAIAGAAAVAGAVSAGVSGADWRDAVEFALAAAEVGARRGRWVAGADIASRIRWAMTLRSLDEVVALVGTSLATQESVPAAFAMLALAAGDGRQAALFAANAGGDTDTIAAMAGAMAGACGFVFPHDDVATVTTVNGLDLAPIVSGLLALRNR